MHQHERLAVLAWSGVDCDGDIKACLHALVAEDPTMESRVHDVLSSAPDQRSANFVAFVREQLDFDVFTERGAVVTTAILAELCGRVLRGELPVPRLGDIVRSLDTGFIDGNRSYPDGLHELWNAFDWCDDSWDLSNQPPLSDILQEFENRFGSAAAG